VRVYVERGGKRGNRSVGREREEESRRIVIEMERTRDCGIMKRKGNKKEEGSKNRLTTTIATTKRSFLKTDQSGG
jgi:hypothetical protein